MIRVQHSTQEDEEVVNRKADVREEYLVSSCTQIK